MEKGCGEKEKKKSPILMFYPGRLTEVAEKSCRVQFEDGSEKLIGALGITPVRFLILFPLLFLMIFLKDEAVAAPAKTSVSLKTAVSALTKPPVAAVAEPPLQKQVLFLFLFFFLLLISCTSSDFVRSLEQIAAEGEFWGNQERIASSSCSCRCCCTAKGMLYFLFCVLFFYVFCF